MKRVLAVTAIPAILLFSAGCADRETLELNEKTKNVVMDKVVPVKAVAVFSQDVEETLEVTGQFQVDQDSAIGALIGGKLTSVYVKEGDRVSAGQVIAVQETTDLHSRLNQALNQESAARAQVQQAHADATAAPSRSSSAVRAAEARVNQAKQRLARLRNGSRSEEIAQSEAQVTRSESDLKTAKSAMERARRLFAEGALAKAEVEVAENRYENAMAAYKLALESRSIVKDPVREEDLKATEQELAVAQEGLRIEKTNKTLDITFKDRLEAARANLRSAQETVKLARKALSDASIRAPFSGRIVGRPAQPGTVLGPGSPVARLVTADSVYFEAQVPENRIARISSGMTVEITVDALGGATLQGTVQAINPLATSVARLYTVRVLVQDSADMLKPGMFGKGQMVVGMKRGVFVLPESCVRQEGDEATVTTVVNGKAKRRPVKILQTSGTKIHAEGLKDGDKVVVRGQDGLLNDTPVKLEGESEPGDPTQAASPGEEK